MKRIITISLLASLLLCSCGTAAESSMQSSETESAPGSAAEATTEITEEASEEEASLAVASGDDVIAADAVGYEGMQAVYGDALKDGEYPISVDSSSSMFKIADCKLIVQEGSLTAELTINSKSYEYLFAGSAEQAAQADPASFIEPDETDSGCVFTFPVEALDQETDCAAFSRKKELWYDRKLVFRADSLPDDAFVSLQKTTAASLALADGEYTVNVTLAGGSGKASVQSPAKLTVSGGNATAEIIWSSNKYDYMLVDSEKYLPTSTEEYSVFEIPVACFDAPIQVAADTNAMSTPHEIEYTLTFDSGSIQ